MHWVQFCLVIKASFTMLDWSKPTVFFIMFNLFKQNKEKGWRSILSCRLRIWICVKWQKWPVTWRKQEEFKAWKYYSRQKLKKMSGCFQSKISYGFCKLLIWTSSNCIAWFTLSWSPNCNHYNNSSMTYLAVQEKITPRSECCLCRVLHMYLYVSTRHAKADLRQNNSTKNIRDPPKFQDVSFRFL